MDHRAATDHPRPLLRRRWSSLDGPWEFAFDRHATAARPDEADFDRTITVPYAPETPASGIGDTTSSLRTWYRSEVPTEAPDGTATVLHFGAVDRQATIWVDGQPVAHHEGGYTPFSVDLSAHATGPSAVVVVQADDDPADQDAPRGKQEWLDDPHFIWYPRTSGIWRTVWAEHVPCPSVAELDWHGDPGSMTVTLRARIAGPVAEGTRLVVRLRSASRLLVDDSTLVTGSELRRTYAIGDGGGPIDLRLVLDQGYWPDTGLTPPDSEALRRDLELTRQLGFHGARKHQKVEDLRYLAWADRMGMLVWVELPSAYRPGPSSAHRLLREWAEIIRMSTGHPSVVAWVPVNESWGVRNIRHDPAQRALVRALTEMANALDGTRPVSANDGWETTGGDIVGIHDYGQDADVLRARYRDRATVDRFLTALRPDGRPSDLDGRAAEGRAVMLSEFGGISVRPEEDDDSGTWGYQEANSADDLLSRYADLWAAVRDCPGLAGACWTQLTDTYQEANGLLHADRSPKAPLESFARATRGH